jgi:hypothetical protein
MPNVKGELSLAASDRTLIAASHCSYQNSRARKRNKQRDDPTPRTNNNNIADHYYCAR